MNNTAGDFGHPPTDTNHTVDWQARLATIHTPDHTVTDFKAALTAGDDALASAFTDGADIGWLVQARAELVDAILISVWNRHMATDAPACLVAVGGYGRSELLPHSDIDLLVLYAEDQLETLAGAIESFITAAWDIGLAIGHSVRCPSECRDQAAADITIATNLMESRALTGDRQLFDAVHAATSPDQLWNATAFFHAKCEEQRARHARFDDSAYRLEPNIKESPGGLRDIQMIAWVTKRYFATGTLDGLVAHGFLTREELNELTDGQRFLWRVRFVLHGLTGRAENRLLFDYQVAIAEKLGFTASENNLAVENFMQKYYRIIRSLSALGDILIQLFSEATLNANPTDTPQPLTDNFQSRSSYIEVVDDAVFDRQPSAILELFHVLQTRPNLVGIRARTLRLLRDARKHIDDEFRTSLRCRLLFSEILNQRSGVTRALRRMNRYGILGRYLPNFGRIIGRMQYDLFHTLTVDEHSLFVVRNLRRLALPRFNDELPFASSLMQNLDKPQLMVIAGLMHDIAKGRGGDHSELGATDAREFCRQHGIASADTELVCWLVRHHLDMSMTAQRRDINDINVIYEFAREVGTQARLDRLYIFTICDIRATNPELWNGWRRTLLGQLYTSTRRVLERGLDTPISETELIAETRSSAAAMLTRSGIKTPDFKHIWAQLDRDYFLRHTPEEIARQTQAIAHHHDDGPLISIEHIADRSTIVFVYCRDRDYLFGVTAGALARTGVSVQDARINSTHDGHTLDTYIVSEADGSQIAGPGREAEIRDALAGAINDPSRDNIAVARRAPRRHRQFNVPTQIYFRSATERGATAMEIITADRPGVLSEIGGVFRRQHIVLQNAKIATIGERAEDVFFITDHDGDPISNRDAQRELRRALTIELDRPSQGQH